MALIDESVLVSEGLPDQDPIYRTVRSVKIGDTDASGLIHFPNVSHWVAETFDDWFSSMGFGVLRQFAVGHCVTVVNSDITIRRSLGTGDELEVETWVSSVGTHSFKVTMRMTNARTRELAVIAELTHVWVQFTQPKGGGTPAVTKAPIPPWIRKLAQRAEEVQPGP